MASYECPDAIFKFFEREEDLPKGRELLAEWLRALPMKVGDWVWTPEHGWLRKCDYGMH